ncbi:MAG: lysine--tRNA ligase [Candidatus Pacebacteria bacterium]|jgi:lysyl-tRNA synthetase class 2|nr:lysine--tRNA ligase [Candidatus Paceibacterota bacterium]
MATNEELRKVRLAKLENIRKAGVRPYPVSTKRTHTVGAVFSDWDKLAAGESEITVAGRIRSMRGHGGMTFVDIEDGTGKIQALFKKDGLGEKSYQFFADNFDVGDFAEARGTVFVTKRGEKTIDARDYKILAKSLLPLPEKWHGLQDVEERYRKRYLDLIFNEDIRKKFILRTQVIKTIREFLDGHGFMEVETPILQTIYGGATAKPFKTHLNAYDMDVFLRIAPELFLKKLLVGGFEKVYEIGKCFRNEGVDKQHNPDFTMLEFYWAYADYKQLMKLTEELVSHVLTQVLGTTKINYQGTEIDFATPWLRVEYTELLKKETKIDYWTLNRDGLAAKARELGVEVANGAGKPEIADEIYKKYCRPNIVQPTFLIHYPKECKPLAKQLEDGGQVSANFQLVVNSFEIVNAYSEQSDPIVQAEQLKQQEELFKQGFEEAQRTDTDFIDALEYGMPPAAGFGMGIDRFVALLTDSNALREIILFPIMKPRTEPKDVDLSSRVEEK